MIRLAVAIAPEQALPSAFVVLRGIEESIKTAARMGYDGVELALRNRAQIDVAQVKALVAGHGLAVPCVSTGQVFADANLNLSDADPAVRSRCIGQLKELCEVAAEFSALVNLGRVRGFLPEEEPARSAHKKIAAEGIAQVGEYAASLGVTLIVEPVNRYETNFLNCVDEAAAFIQEFAIPNLKLMPDVFHMNIEDAGIAQTLARHMAQIGYVHFADSNRLAPGWGHLDFTAIIGALQDGGYDGWASIEILPKPDPISAAQKAIETIRPLL